MSLPNEILENVFSHLSHRYLSEFSLVSKQWYAIIHQPMFFNTIKLLTSRQFHKFIHMAATVKVNDKAVGFYVQHLILGDSMIKFFERHMKLTYRKQLNNICPNIQSIENFVPYGEAINDFTQLKTLEYWPKLTKIPYWLAYYEKDWYIRFISDNNNKKITSLEFMIKDVKTIPHNANFDTSDDSCIQFKMDQQRRKRKYMQVPLINNEGEIDTIDENFLDQFFVDLRHNNGFIWHHGKVMKVPSNWQHLDHLLIDFSFVCKHNIRTLGITFQIDERSIDSIHQSCPLLTSFIISGLFFNISDDYFENRFKVIGLVTPCNVKRFEMINCYIQQRTCFHYLIKKYPYLNTLKLHLKWSNDRAIVPFYERDLHAISLQQFITSLNNLSTLSIRYKDILRGEPFPWDRKGNYWKATEFMDWLIEHPTQLKSLEYPFAFYSIDKYNLNDDEDSSEDWSEDDLEDFEQFEERMIKREAYLHHLTDLYMESETDIPRSLEYIMDDDILNKDYGSLSVKSLTINYVGKSVVNDYIDFDDVSDDDSSDDNFGPFNNELNDNYFNPFNGFDNFNEFDDDSDDTDSDYIDSDSDSNEIGYTNVVHFFSWLAAFPNLKKLSLQNLILTDEDMVFFYKRAPQLRKECYSLEELHINSCQVKFKNGLSSICQLCPSLHILKLDEVDIYDEGNLLNFNFNKIIINAPELAIDELLIKDVFVNGIGFNSDVKSVNLHVNQSVNGDTFTITRPEKKKDKKKKGGKKNNKKKKRKNKKHNKKKNNNKKNKHEDDNEKEGEGGDDSIFKIIFYCKSVDAISCNYDNYIEDPKL